MISTPTPTKESSRKYYESGGSLFRFHFLLCIVQLLFVSDFICSVIQIFVRILCLLKFPSYLQCFLQVYFLLCIFHCD